MTLDQYNAIKEKTIADLPFTEAVIFDPEGSPLMAEILKSFDFYYKTLVSECDHYGITEPYIFISSDTSKNASAGSIGTKYVIKLNVGLLHWLISKFQLGTTIMVNADLKALEKLDNKLDIEINEFYYQFYPYMMVTQQIYLMQHSLLMCHHSVFNH